MGTEWDGRALRTAVTVLLGSAPLLALALVLEDGLSCAAALHAQVPTCRPLVL